MGLLTTQWMGYPIYDYIMLAMLVIVGLIVDGRGHRNHSEPDLKSQVIWTGFWVFVAFIYACYLYHMHGAEVGSSFVAGYLLEKSLSVDNLFVISAIMTLTKVPARHQHTVLYWGVMGAIVFRMIFIAGASWMISNPVISHYAEVVFGAIILYTAFVMIYGNKDDDDCVENMMVYKIVKKMFGGRMTTEGSEDGKLITKVNGKLMITSLMFTMILVESADIMFSFDSVPAVTAVTKDFLVCYSAVVLAMLGLRQLYFVMEAAKDRLHYLEHAIEFLLVFVGVKILMSGTDGFFHHGYHIGVGMSTSIIVLALTTGVLFSLYKTRNVTIQE